jgi:hypothetical protein
MKKWNQKIFEKDVLRVLDTTMHWTLQLKEQSPQKKLKNNNLFVHITVRGFVQLFSVSLRIFLPVIKSTKIAKIIFAQRIFE